VTWRSDDDEWCWLRPRGNVPLAPLLEEPPPDDGCHRNDCDPHASEDHANHPTPHLAPVRRGGGRAHHAVRSDARISFALPPLGAGYVYQGTREQRYGRQEVISAIQTVGVTWDGLPRNEQAAHASNPSLVPRPLLQIIAIGDIGGGPLRKNHPRPNADPFHKSHDLGVDVDISVVRCDGKLGRSTYKAKDAAT
jgi:hypothetical protein